ncbi:MAG: Gfo/Idh/MocA family oxidoreductase [Planctomycetes bacterium]|nr:Gfo/Idh/MocA family oxidoreductase [Planctomycetota bacterium]
MKLGIIGCGGRISGMVKAFKEVCPELKVTAVLDPDQEKARGRLPEDSRADAKFHSTVKELIEVGKPDAIAIGTRCDLHTPYAVQVAAYDLPLYLEKPVSNSMEQATALERAFATSKCQVVVSFPLRVSPLCVRARRLIDEGAVGRVEHILGINYVPYGSVYFDSWYKDYKITGGLFLQKATHDLDYLMYLAGAPIVRVAAMTSKGRVFRDASTKGKNPDPSVSFYEGIGTPETGMNEDSSSALLEFANGAKGVYTQIFFVKRSAGARGATVTGWNGTISFDWNRKELKRVWHHEPFDDVMTPAFGEGHGGGDQILAKNFVEVVQGKAKTICPIKAGLDSAFACLAARESADTGRFIDVHQPQV